MRLNTTIVITKGFCFVIVGVFGPWAAALAQWIGTGEWPPRIVWVAVILPASAIGGANSLLSFLSSAFRDYTDDQPPKVDAPPKPDKPAV